MIEDAAEAIGSYNKNQHLGTFGKIGILSFNGNKTISSAGGGAILTSDKKLEKKLNILFQMQKFLISGNIHIKKLVIIIECQI